VLCRVASLLTGALALTRSILDGMCDRLIYNTRCRHIVTTVRDHGRLSRFEGLLAPRGKLLDLPATLHRSATPGGAAL
jgi:hypothetical protein